MSDKCDVCGRDLSELPDEGCEDCGLDYDPLQPEFNEELNFDKESSVRVYTPDILDDLEE